LRAGGERISLNYVIKKGGMLFPDLVCFADGGEAVLIVVYHLKKILVY